MSERFLSRRAWIEGEQVATQTRRKVPSTMPSLNRKPISEFMPL